jgi:hypothetical protein
MSTHGWLIEAVVEGAVGGAGLFWMALLSQTRPVFKIGKRM